MIKKVVFALIALTIIIAGYTGFKQLNYLQRSARIFSYNADRSSVHGFDRSHSNLEDRDRMNTSTSYHDFPGRPGFSCDSLNRNVHYQKQHRSDPEYNNARLRTDNVERHQLGESGRAGMHSRKSVNLRNVIWYLTVFASVAVLTLYADRFIRFMTTSRAKSHIRK